jgi:hypothetical protein
MIEVVVPGFNHYKYIVVVFAKRSHHWVVFIDTKCSTQILNKNSSIWSPYFFWVWFQTQQWGLQVFDLIFEQMESLTLVSIFY